MVNVVPVIVRRGLVGRSCESTATRLGGGPGGLARCGRRSWSRSDCRVCRNSAGRLTGRSSGQPARHRDGDESTNQRSPCQHAEVEPPSTQCRQRLSERGILWSGERYCTDLTCRRENPAEHGHAHHGCGTPHGRRPKGGLEPSSAPMPSSAAHPINRHLRTALRAVTRAGGKGLTAICARRDNSVGHHEVVPMVTSRPSHGGLNRANLAARPRGTQVVERSCQGLSIATVDEHDNSEDYPTGRAEERQETDHVPLGAKYPRCHRDPEQI